MNKMVWRVSAAALAPLAIGLVGAVAPATAACVPGTRLCVTTSGEPTPAPSTPRHLVAKAIAIVEQSAPGGGGGDVCQPTLGGVIVIPPLPSPTPGVYPQDAVHRAEATCHAVVGSGGPSDHATDTRVGL